MTVATVSDRARADLERALRREIRGEVRFDDGARALYATDASNYRQVPVGVVVPRDTEDIERAVRLCREAGVPVLPRGGGTSLAGQTCNVAVVLDCSRHLRSVLEIDAAARRARVQPGCVLDSLRDAAEAHHLTFGPDPATHSRCTLGGMIGNNSCGVHSVMSGKTAENVEALDVLLYDGTRLTVGSTPEDELARIIAGGGRRGAIYAGLRDLRDRYAPLIRQRFPRIPRRVSGYNLDELLPEQGFHVARALVGSEGTCVTVLEATLRLVPSPPARVLLVLGYPDVYEAGDHVPEILAFGPIAIEGLDDVLVEAMKRKRLHADDVELLPAGRGWLLVEFGADTVPEAVDRARQAMGALERRARAGVAGPTMLLIEDPAMARIMWRIRESGLGATARVPGERDTWEGWEDAAVAPDRLGAYLRDFRALLDRYGYRCPSLYGHFGDGCVHTRVDFDLVTTEGLARYRRFVEDAADLVVSHGGSLSGEHGDGQARAELLPRMFGPELVNAFREFKRIWDPDGRMNPGKVVDPFGLDEHLRLGAGYRDREVATHFRYGGDDEGRFARSVQRCVGVGACRRTHGGTMCPSYMATLDEAHSTRGRAHLLFEMLKGDVITDGWRSEAVKDALDLCLACKGCKSECPVNVDMATYKAEFLSHYYEGRARPPHAYAFGLIGRWARLASHAPRLANLLTRAPGLGALARRSIGVAPERELPAFAPESFTRWFRRRPPSGAEGSAAGPGASRAVLLWPDTFNNYFLPRTARAAVSVLERAGFSVEIPSVPLCCGRPLYDYGMLDTAKRWLRRILTSLSPRIEAGVPLVGLEPSCIAVFRDELVNLFPDDPLARRLSEQSHLLSEFLVRRNVLPAVDGPRRLAIVQGHCHQQAIMSMRDEMRVLSAAGVDAQLLDSGCCGMAGAFGFERAHYDVSLACAERVLLPAVRAAPADTLVIADGFSCREQIAQCTGRRAVHLAEVLAGEATG